MKCLTICFLLCGCIIVLFLWKYPIPSLVALLFLGGVIYGLWPERVPNAFGQARWASLDELRAAQMVIPRRTPRSYLPLGTVGRTLIGISEARQQRHVLMIAPTGGGKTAGIILPALLSEQGNRSLVINDTKGELQQKCLGYLAERHGCFVFAPTRPHKSHCYNPLAYIHTMEDAQDFAECWVSNTGTSQEPFWDNAAQLLITATVLHLRSAEPDAPLSRLAELFCGGIAYDDLQRMLLESPAKLARNTATSFFHSLAQNPKLVGSIMTEMATRFFTLQDPAIATVTASNTIDFETMLYAPTATFLAIPSTAAKRLRPLSACFLMQMMNTFVRSTEENRPAKGIAFYLDEFANIGVIPHFTQHISLVRSSGIAFLLAIQNFGQLKILYEEEGLSTIRANCTTQILFPGAGAEETEHYSRVLGTSTIELESSAQAKTKPQSWSEKETRTTTQSKSLAARPFMHPEELRTMQRGTLLIVSDNMKPFKVQNIPYFQQPDILARTHLAPPDDLFSALLLEAPEQEPREEGEVSPTTTTETQDDEFWLS